SSPPTLLAAHTIPRRDRRERRGPLCLPRFNVDNVARRGALGGMCSEIPDLPYRIELLTEGCRCQVLGKDLVDLGRQCSLCDPFRFPNGVLKTPTAECGTGLGTDRQNERSLAVVGGEI